MLVENYRDGQKVKQRTILSLGSIENLDTTKLYSLAKKLLKYCDHNNLVDVSDANTKNRTNWGAPAIVDKLWNLFSLDKFFKDIVKKSKLKYAVEDCIKLMLIDRLCSPRSKLQTYSNASYYNGFTGIELQNLYRTLDFLSGYKEALEHHIFCSSEKIYGLPVEVVFFDVTTFYFESNKSDSLRDFGYSKDAKFNEVQVVLSMLVNHEGRPVGFDLFEGNTYEGKTLTDALIKLKERYSIKKSIIVADRGINSGLNLCEIKKNDFDYIMGCRIKSVKKSLQDEILNLDKYEDINTGDSQEVLKYRIINYKKEIYSEHKLINTIDERIICTWSSKRARKDKKDRERLVLKAKEMIATNTLDNKRGAKKYVNSKHQGSATLNEDKIIDDAKWDGFYGIETSEKQLSAQEVMSAYHQLYRIEESFRILKSHLETRPVYHWTPSRIKGHFILSYIAFLFERTIEIELRNAGISPISPKNIRKSLLSMEFNEIDFSGKCFKFAEQPDELGKIILKTLKVDEPKKVEAA